MLVFIQNIICLKLQVVEIPRELKAVPLFLDITRAGFNFIRVTQCTDTQELTPVQMACACQPWCVWLIAAAAFLKGMLQREVNCYLYIHIFFSAKLSCMLPRLHSQSWDRRVHQQAKLELRADAAKICSCSVLLRAPINNTVILARGGHCFE